MAEWVMVWITVIYVIATVIMCFLNYKAVTLTKKQLIEMKLQFYEQQKYSSMPILQVKLVENKTNEKSNGFDRIRLFEQNVNIHADKRKSFRFLIVNVGQGIAKNVSYHWENSNNSSKLEIFSLPVNDYRIIDIEFMASSMIENDSLPIAIIKFTDINDITYEQKLYFHLLISEAEIHLVNTPISAPKTV